MYEYVKPKWMDRVRPVVKDSGKAFGGTVAHRPLNPSLNGPHNYKPIGGGELASSTPTYVNVIGDYGCHHIRILCWHRVVELVQ